MIRLRSTTRWVTLSVTAVALASAAKLNFGDCLAYAVSAVMRAPLLFKREDFGLTDVIAHPAAIRV